jgi:hypothetical protein
MVKKNAASGQEGSCPILRSLTQTSEKLLSLQRERLNPGRER